MPEFKIRPIQPEDAVDAAHLSAQLGYPVDNEVMRARIAALAQDSKHTVLVASSHDGRVAGWIDIGIVQHLQSEAYGEIGGLVVTSEARSQGLGRKLLASAEEWIAAKGIQKALVRSQIARERAHAFYLREGYARTKTSAVFAKDLNR